MRAREIGLAVKASLLGVAALYVSALSEANAQQAPPSSQQSAGAPVDNNGVDFTRPQTLLQLRYIYQTAPGSGIVPGTTRTVTSDTGVLRSDVKIDLTQQWTLALRGDLPFVAKDAITADDPGGAYVGGLGDADAQAALIRTISARWAAGGGLRIIAPTGTEDLSSGKWQALPIVGARYMLPELSSGSFFTALARYDVGFAGPSTKNISNLQLAPTLNVSLPDHWFVTFYPDPDIRLNYGSPIVGQTGRLFLPLDLMVGREVTNDITVSLEVGFPIVNDYPVYNFKTVVRFNRTF